MLKVLRKLPLTASLCIALTPISWAEQPQLSKQEALAEYNQIAFEIFQLLESKTAPEQIDILNRSREKYTNNPFANELILSFLAEQHSYIGDHKKSMDAMYESRVSKLKRRQHNGKDSHTIEAPITSLSSLQRSEALNLIIGKAKDNQILMLNEAHHIAQHRVLPLMLLDDLYEQGYRYLAVEALSRKNVPPQGLQGNEIQPKHGTYISEPIYAMFVEKAHRLGFKLVSYDARGKDREVKAANNIIEKVFKEDPDAKLLVHCGYGHINETHMLGGVLKEKLGIDPITINQTTISEDSYLPDEIELYDRIVKDADSHMPFVLRNNNRQLYSANPSKYDISLFWPKTTYESGRPTWAKLDRDLIFAKQSWCENSFPACLKYSKAIT